jgi:hypothetical protein
MKDDNRIASVSKQERGINNISVNYAEDRCTEPIERFRIYPWDGVRVRNDVALFGDSYKSDSDFVISDAQIDRYQSQPELFMGDLKGDNKEEQLQFAET